MKNLEKDLITSFVSSINSKDTMDIRRRRIINASKSINLHDYVIKQELDEAVSVINTSFSQVFDDLNRDQSKFTGDGSTSNWDIGSAGFDTFRYLLVGKLLTIWFHITDTVIAGTPATLSYELPAIWVGKTLTLVPIFSVFSNLYTQDCYAMVNQGTNFLDIRRMDSASWTNGTNGFAGMIQLEIM